MKAIVAAELDAELSAKLKRFAQAAGTFKTRVVRLAMPSSSRGTCARRARTNERGLPKGMPHSTLQG
jgi:hypothetical protein